MKELYPGIGQAVAERTILRKKKSGRWETWGEVADRVALGNSLLSTSEEEQKREHKLLKKYIADGKLLMSGRHLQHGDEKQPERNMEVFTNCATSATSFKLFYFLLNGSGVGRAYDDDMMLVDWTRAPNLRCVLDESHPDFDYSAHESVRQAKHKYTKSTDTLWYTVPDDREGWAKALELWENAAFEKIHADKTLVLDFSAVRAKGSPIGGMQNRPASGPVPLMNAFNKASSIKGCGLPKWAQTMYVDHYFAECVLVGGARRAARMATKYWKDKGIIDFCHIKRPVEYDGLKMDEIMALPSGSESFLWSSNNSIAVDDEFWRLLKVKRGTDEYMTEICQHARKLFKTATQASYGDGTGEPGFLNVHKLVQKSEGWTDLNRGDYVGGKMYQINDDTQIYLSKLAKKAKRKKYHMICNPCGEIALNILGGFCVIADMVPYNCDSQEEIIEMAKATTRALIRVNTMDSTYNKEVKRTNRIGVGMTGVHEFAWKHFGYGFRDLVDEEKSKDFWLFMAEINRTVYAEAERYSKELGLPTPHTATTIKPAGTTSKLFGLTEGWHLPSMNTYLRWVQFRNDDPLVADYKAKGYPTRDLVTYSDTTIVGFPTALEITQLGLGDKLVTAGEATPEEQYKWLLLGEKYWIKGTDASGDPLNLQYGNQISYTLKYDPKVVDYPHFRDMLKKYQAQVSCCSVMPQEDTSAYEYLPETPISKAEYEQYRLKIKGEIAEDIDKVHIDCEGGICPVDFNK